MASLAIFTAQATTPTTTITPINHWTIGGRSWGRGDSVLFSRAGRKASKKYAVPFSFFLRGRRVKSSLTDAEGRE
jgi:hypothetical protein